MPGDEMITRINSGLNHFCKRVGVVEDAGHILEDCDGDLKEKCKEHHQVTKVTILTVRTALCPSATPVWTRESPHENTRPMLEEVRPPVYLTYVWQPI